MFITFLRWLGHRYRSASSRVVRDDVRFPDFLSLAGPRRLCFCAAKEPNNQTQVATQPSAGVTGELEVHCFMHPESVTPERTSAISNY